MAIDNKMSLVEELNLVIPRQDDTGADVVVLSYEDAHHLLKDVMSRKGAWNLKNLKDIFKEVDAKDNDDNDSKMDKVAARWLDRAPTNTAVYLRMRDGVTVQARVVVRQYEDEFLSAWSVATEAAGPDCKTFRRALWDVGCRKIISWVDPTIPYYQEMINSFGCEVEKAPETGRHKLVLKIMDRP